jgi:hypothetical protein
LATPALAIQVMLHAFFQQGFSMWQIIKMGVVLKAFTSFSTCLFWGQTVALFGSENKLFDFQLRMQGSII